MKLFVTVQTHLSDERGQDLIEYALLAALIAVGCVVGMKTLASNITSLFGQIGSQLTAA